MAGKEAWTEGRLRTRPAAAAGAGPVGLQPLELGAAREGYLYVPPTYHAEHTAPLVVLLHGAGEDARDGLALLRGQADGAGLILLAPSSREYTWDVIASRRYGPDIAAIDRALEWAFSPGFMAPAGQEGSPRVFVSHGTRDGWLPIDRCSRVIVPQLERAGYEVRYREFVGGHVVPPEIAHEAAGWFVAEQG